MSKRKSVPVSESIGRELDMWKKAYGLSHIWQVEKALQYAYSFPEQVFHIKKNEFLREDK